MSMEKCQLCNQDSTPWKYINGHICEDCFKTRKFHGGDVISMNIYYKLDENKNVIPSTMEECNIMLMEGDRIVAEDFINEKRISTVFLCIDHNFYGKLPLVFETMVFDKNYHELYCRRYPTWKDAKEGHKQAIKWVEDGCNDT